MPSIQSDTEKALQNSPSHNSQNASNTETPLVMKKIYRTNTQPFIGRLGGNQGFVLDGRDGDDSEKVKEAPDAAPCMSIRDQLGLGGFRCPGLWKAGVLEGVGMSFSFLYFIDGEQGKG